MQGRWPRSIKNKVTVHLHSRVEATLLKQMSKSSLPAVLGEGSRGILVALDLADMVDLGTVTLEARRSQDQTCTPEADAPHELQKQGTFKLVL